MRIIHQTIRRLSDTIREYRVPLFVWVIGVALSMGAFTKAVNNQIHNIELDFSARARLEARIIDDNLVVHLEKVHGMMNVAKVVNGTPGPTLLRYAQTVLERVPFAAIGWIAQKTPSQSFIAWPDGTTHTMALNDILKRVDMRNQLSSASLTGIAFSRPFTLSKLSRTDHFILMASTVEPYGTVVGLVSLRDITALSPLVKDKLATVYLFEGDEWIYTAGYLANAKPTHTLTHEALIRRTFYQEYMLDSANNTWRIIFVPSPRFIDKTTDLLPWISLGSGLLITGLLCITLFMQRRQTLMVMQRVDEQTQQIRESNERTELIVRSALDGIITMNQDGKITQWNERAEAIFDWSHDEAVGRILSEIIIPHEYRAAHEVGIKHFLKTGEGPVLNKRIELSALHRKGHLFPIELSITAQRLHGEYYFTAFIRDISERKKTEAEKERLIHDLQRSNQELDDFAYIASHDLKEPLRGLHNHSRFLIEDNAEKLDKESVDRLNRLLYLTQRMEKLVNDLLYFSRLGRAELAVQETDMNEVVRDIESMLDVMLAERHGRIVIPKLLPTIVCDKTRVTEVLRNLITNALKYNDKPEKLVEIGFFDEREHPNGEIIPNVLYVKDNGVGIALEFHNEVFRIFRRLQHKAVTCEEGTGVGLTFVKKIIERHGGKIWLESQPGNGTVFYFNLERKPL